MICNTKVVERKKKIKFIALYFFVSFITDKNPQVLLYCLEEGNKQIIQLVFPLLIFFISCVYFAAC